MDVQVDYIICKEGSGSAPVELWECQFCTVENEMSSRVCIGCFKTNPRFLEEEAERKKKEEEERARRESAFVICEVCSSTVDLADFEDHLNTCERLQREKESEKQDIECEICKVFVPLVVYEAHLEECEKIKLRKDREDADVNCEFCGKSFPLSVFQVHSQECEEEFKADNTEIKCDMCKVEMTAKDYEAHIEACLRTFRAYDEKATEKIQCPMCKKHVRTEFFEIHVHGCYDVSEGRREGGIFCPICTLRLTKMNKKRHITLCKRARDLEKARRDRGDPFYIPDEDSGSGSSSVSEIDTDEDEEEEEEVKEISSLDDKDKFVGDYDYGIDYSDPDRFAEVKHRLTARQVKCMRKLQKQSEKKSQAAKSGLLTKFKRLGFTKKDLENVEDYIANYAPLVIHVHVDKYMKYFIKDTHYRNQFETSFSSGSTCLSSRRSWETRMFGDSYPEKCPHFERPKYGTINFTNDPKGVSSCSSYGGSYFLLEDNVRDRCTITDQDSSSSSCEVGTLKHCLHVVNKFSDSELKGLVQASRASEGSSAIQSTYKEIQIHGPIEFKKDIITLYANSKHKKDAALCKQMDQFKKRFKKSYEFFG